MQSIAARFIQVFQSAPHIPTQTGYSRTKA
jgi:hypothetical protein